MCCVWYFSMAFSVHWSSPTGGQCPSVAHVSTVQSGLSYNVTVLAEKPNCSGWEDIVLYSFTIVCDTNCSSEYRDSENSSAPMWVFPDVSAGVFIVIVRAENSCGEQTVSVHKNISISELCTSRLVCIMYTEPGINFTYTNAAILVDLHTLVIPPYRAVFYLRL